MAMRAMLVLALIGQCQYVTSYVASPSGGRLLLRSLLRTRYSVQKAVCHRNKFGVFASLEEDLGKPFGEFGRKVGKSIDWFFDTSHVTGGIIT